MHRMQFNICAHINSPEVGHIKERPRSLVPGETCKNKNSLENYASMFHRYFKFNKYKIKLRKFLL